MNEYPLLRWIVFIPLFGAIINGYFALRGKKLSSKFAGSIASLAALLSFALSLSAFFQLKSLSGELPQLKDHLYTWIAAGRFQVDIAFLLDPLSAVMILVVTGVGSLIHIYSIGYMEEDPSPARYFSYLNLFMFAMLVLVLGDSLLTMFIGWEGVGLASYLLIGFWFEDTEKAKAGMKAFIVNRIGDLGFLIGIMTIFWGIAGYLQAGQSFSFETIKANIQHLYHWKIGGIPAVELAAFCLFIGAVGKSAQIPLYVWLPDAMAGPTPVSALIHAATMVTAGVYMVARMNFLYSLAPSASYTVALIGALTALFAASIGLFQNDIKKVLAYSTVSQLGYMFIGVGVGAYSAGIFHLMTHAFFKALLFLGAGSVIVGMHHIQDIRKMGGLFKYMKITGTTFLLATLAIIGFPGFSGFFSKDEILWKALSSGNILIWTLGTIGAILTAFYMTRLFSLTFLGELRLSKEELEHLPHKKPHETGWSMTIPLMILAVLSVIGGWIGLPHFLTHKEPPFETWLHPVFANSIKHHSTASALAGEASKAPFGEGTAMLIAILGMLIGAIAALWIYAGKKKAERALEKEKALQQPETSGIIAAVYKLIYNKYYVDEIYRTLIVKPLVNLSRDGLWPFDMLIIDGLVNLAAKIAQLFGRFLSWIQSGNVKLYLYAMAVGLLSFLLWLMITSAAL